MVLEMNLAKGALYNKYDCRTPAWVVSVIRIAYTGSLRQSDWNSGVLIRHLIQDSLGEDSQLRFSPQDITILS